MKSIVLYLSKTKTLCVTLLTFFLLYVLSNTIFQSSFTYLTQEFGYSSKEAYTLLSSIGDGGRSNHLLILLSDFIMVLLYSSFLIGIQYRLAIKLSTSCKLVSFLTFLPLILSITHLLEIAFTIILIKDFSDAHIALAKFTSLLTSIKYVLTPCIFLLPFLLLGAKILFSKTKRKIDDESKC